jgi:uncharacterized protein (DUF58 family)
MKNMKKWVILILLPIIIGVSASASGFSLIWKLCILSILAPLVLLAWSWLNVRGIKAQIRSLPAKTFIGDVLENKLKLTNVSRVPKVMLKIQENTDLPGYSNVASFNLGRGSSYTLNSLACCLRRGKYTLGSYTLTASDPLGLFPRQIVLGEPQSVLIYPNSVDLPFFDPLSSLSLVYGAGQWIQSQISPNVSSIREYSSGDSLKHIHWGSTAHSGQLMVKLFDPDRSHSSAKTIWIVLDLQGDVQCGEGLQSTEEYGVSIAASLAKKYIESGWPVGFLTVGNEPYLFPAESSAQQSERISAALAAVKASGNTPLEEVLASQSGRFDLDTLIIIISPSWSERLVSSLLQLKSQQGVVTAILLDPETFGAERSQKHTAHTLALNGVQVYVVRKGDNIAAALDTRNLSTNKL